MTLMMTCAMTFSAPSWGQVPPPEPEIAACLNQKAAQNIGASQEYLIARAYEKGECSLKADPQAAMQWYTRGAARGDVFAQHELGEIAFTGRMGATDYPAAKKWYAMAAKQGHGLSQLRMGFLCAEAHFKGLTPDYKEAEKWFLMAAEQNAGDAQFRLGNFYHNYKNPPDLARAVHWLTKAAEGGHRVAMFDLARMLKKGEGAKADPEQAAAWMKKAAEQDLVSAQMTLSEMYAAGDGVEKDPQQSFAWALKVAQAPSAIAYWLNKVADYYYAEKDYASALPFYERAVAKGDVHAQARLGKMYLGGQGVPRDRAKGKSLLRAAAASGDAEAKSLLKKK